MTGPVRWLVTVAGVGVFLAWLVFLERTAESGAREFCAGVEAGGPLEAVARRAAGVGEERLRRVDADLVVVGFTGIPPFSRHLCEVTGKDGTVAGARYLHLD